MKSFNEIENPQWFKKFQLNFFDKFGDDYEFIKGFPHKSTRIRIRHLACGCVRTSTSTTIMRSAIACVNKACRGADAHKKAFGLSVFDFADICTDDLIVRDKINGLYVSVVNKKVIKSEKIHCDKGHVYHVNLNHDYREIECPVCNILENEEYKRFEENMNKLIAERDQRSA